MNSMHSKAGTESYNSAGLPVDGAYTDLVLSCYATSGRRLPKKEQMLNSSTGLGPPHWHVAVFPLLFSHQTLHPKLCHPNHTFHFPDNS